MNNYLNDITNIIRNGSMENTYKMSWIRSLVEYCSKHPDVKTIHFDELSKLIFKYYWNQTFFFNLEQGPNTNKKPEIHQMVLEEIEKYQKKYNFKPVYFTKVENKIILKVENEIISQTFPDGSATSLEITNDVNVVDEIYNFTKKFDTKSEEKWANPSSDGNRYTEQMKTIRDGYFSSFKNREPNAFYVFVIPGFNNPALNSWSSSYDIRSITPATASILNNRIKSSSKET